ncbi:hypothetical protein [Hyphomonas sp.]|uniref:hypothetical protein n=1 Tax=Hyphomonas sp. TaxID=87 RepID=UPI003528A978
MLLRRVMEHVKAQNWTAVAIDFVIVVFGVFIGIQLGNWNQSRADASLERDFLAKIVVDLQSDAQNLQSGIDMADINVRAAYYTLDQAGLAPASTITLPVDVAVIPGGQLDVAAPADMSDEDKRHLWALAVVRLYPGQSSTAFDTLMATGRLDLIRDHDLVTKLQAYRAQWEDIEAAQTTTFRAFRNQAVFIGQKQGFSPFAAIPEEEFVALVRDTPELAGTLRTMMEYSVLHGQVLQRTRQTTLDLLRSLGAEEAPYSPPGQPNH